MKQLSQIYLVLLLFAALSGCTTIGYYSQAVSGHLSLMMAGTPVNEVLASDGISNELREKLRVSQYARLFAKAKLALPVDDAFTEYVELDRPWVVVNLVAVPAFSLEPHRWCYPFLGCQAYRGYFSLQDAQREQQVFNKAGYDTFIGGVTAYSTLGWFDDPLHSGFTRLPEDRMVALMFHELAHRVVYIENDTAFNESFATAVELEGLKLWLAQRGHAEAFQYALERFRHRNQTLTLVHQTTAELQQLYQQKTTLPEAQIRRQKAHILDDLLQRYNHLSADWHQPGPLGENPPALNNANLALFQQYNQYVPGFRQLLRDNEGDFPAFYQAAKDLSGLPDGERAGVLASLSERFNKNL
jgi:predicted aminopeptidase